MSTVKEIPVNIKCIEYRQDKADTDYGSCLYARFYFNMDRYELSIVSDCGQYGYKWYESDDETFMELMARVSGGYLLEKLCGNPKVFDYEATKEHFYDYADDEDDKKRLDEIFEEIECKYIPDNGETFIELFEQENDGWWADVWEYPIYDYTPNQKRIGRVFEEHIRPYIRKMLEVKDGN